MQKNINVYENINMDIVMIIYIFNSSKFSKENIIQTVPLIGKIEMPVYIL